MQKTYKCQSKSKNQLKNCACKKHTWNSSTWACKNDEYLRNIISDSIVWCDKITEPLKNALISFGNKKAIYFTFLLMTMLLLIIASIYCYYYYIKHWD